jgi:hypothetical protein
MKIHYDELIARGYRRTSRRHCLVSRIDRQDWKDVLSQHLNSERAELDKRIRGFPGMWEDFYRRVLSKDTLTVSPDILLKVPTSDRDPAGYVP